MYKASKFMQLSVRLAPSIAKQIEYVCAGVSHLSRHESMITWLRNIFSMGYEDSSLSTKKYIRLSVCFALAIIPIKLLPKMMVSSPRASNENSPTNTLIVLKG